MNDKVLEILPTKEGFKGFHPFDNVAAKITGFRKGKKWF